VETAGVAKAFRPTTGENRWVGSVKRIHAAEPPRGLPRGGLVSGNVVSFAVVNGERFVEKRANGVILGLAPAMAATAERAMACWAAAWATPSSPRAGGG
jgi:hypothetical protein